MFSSCFLSLSVDHRYSILTLGIDDHSLNSFFAQISKEKVERFNYLVFISDGSSVNCFVVQTS